MPILHHRLITLAVLNAALLSLHAHTYVCYGFQPVPSAQRPLTDEATISARLLRGVDALATAGVPGPLAAFSDSACVLVAGTEDGHKLLPVAVASVWGEGRVVALGHGGMLAKDALGHTGSATFVRNAAAWLASGEHARIGVLRNTSLADLLRAAGFEIVTLENDWSTSLQGLAAVVIDSHHIAPSAREPLAGFIRHGGGLLTAGLGWGWLQLNPGKTIHDHPGNLLLRDAGIAWCDGTLDPTLPNAFRVEPLPDSLHAARAMNSLESAAHGQGELDAQAGTTLISALRVVPRDHALLDRAHAILRDRSQTLEVSQGKPVSSKNATTRVLLALQVEAERTLPARDVRPHPSASSFPGDVPADAPRIERTIQIDLSVTGWHSTGLYAPPGELILVSTSDAPSCRVRIGCHTDHLWHLNTWRRVPDVAREWDLHQPSTEVASAFGGLLYIEVAQASKGTRPFTIRGGVEAPRFVLGETTRQEWLTSRAAPAPWGELESRKVIVSVPSESLRNLDNPSELMQFWDKLSDAHATLAAIPLQPLRPHRFVPDIQISAGYMHSGYPIMTHLDAVKDMTSLDNLRRSRWGLLHELGHNHQEGDWTFEGTGEVTCNLFALHAIDTICTPKPGDRGHDAVNAPPSLTKYLENGAKFDQWKRDPFLALHMYVQLQKAFGWETFRRVFAEYRDLPRDQRPKSDTEKRDQWMVRFSKACGRNLGPFFVAWGVPTSETARKSIEGLPLWMPDDWTK